MSQEGTTSGAGRDDAEARGEALLARMTLDEKVAMLAGRDLWNARGVSRLGIPELRMTDGPIGARGSSFSGGLTAACFPCGTALAATWNPDLVLDVGRALGDEARSKGAHILLGPTVNLHRTPLAGRNFECYSEDPFLTGQIAAAHIRGVQSRGVAATVKHFVCNDSEFERHTISSEVDERTLREVYLAPFEVAVREAGAWAVMAAYNRLNGTYASEDPWLLTRVLREEWAFRGMVVSDWFGTQSTAAAVVAGLDLEMPGPPRHRGDKLAEAVAAGEVSEKQLDARVRALLRVAAWTGALEAPDACEERADDRPAHRRIARRAAADAMVLLENRDAVLPLDPAALRSLAVVGPAVEGFCLQGGGSARVDPHYETSPLAALRARLPAEVELHFEPGCANHRAIPVLDGRHVHVPGAPDTPGFRVEFFAGDGLTGEPVREQVARRAEFTWLGRFTEAFDAEHFAVRCSGCYVAPRDGTASFSLISAGRSRLLVDGHVLVDNWEPSERGTAFFGLGSREVVAGLDVVAGRTYDVEVQYARDGARVLGGLRAGGLAPLPVDALARAERAAAAADAAVVLIGLNADWETEGRDRTSLALPGQQVELARRVAAANPRTAVVLNCGAPVDVEELADLPALLVCWYPGQEGGEALADVLLGAADPGGRLPQTWPRRIEDTPAYLNYPGENGSVRYGEGQFIGYRYYDRKQVAPRYPFGHGLSYTDFAWDGLALSTERIAAGESLRVEVAVRNTGARAGVEVVQLYVEPPQDGPVRPDRVLRAFRKVRLEPGASEIVAFELAARDLAVWDPAAQGFAVPPGHYGVALGRSARSPVLHADLTVTPAAS